MVNKPKNTKVKKKSFDQTCIEGISGIYPKTFFLYLNNNLIRYFLSLDSISIINSIEKIDVLDSIGSYLHDGIILSHTHIYNQKIEEQTRMESNAYTLALQVEVLQNLADNMQALLVKNDYSINVAKVSDYDVNSHICMIILGIVPFSFVSNVVFRTKDELDIFGFGFNNIYAPTDIYKVNQDLFIGGIEIDIEQLKVNFEKFIIVEKVPVKTVEYMTKKRDKIRGVLFGFFYRDSSLTQKYIFRFDKCILDFLQIEINEQKELKNKLLDMFPLVDLQILESLFQNCQNQDIFRHVNLAIELTDSDISEIRKTILSIKNLKKNDYRDLFILSIFLKQLLAASPIYSSFQETIIAIKQEIASSNSEDTETITWLREGLKYIIEEVITDRVSISNVLENAGENKSIALRALMILSKASLPNDIEKLKSNLNSFNVDADLRRLTLMLYGAFNGVSAFSSEYKKDPYINRIIDQTASQMIRHEYIINSVPELAEFSTYRKKDSKTFYSQSGYPFNIEIIQTKEEREVDRIVSYISRIFESNKTKLAERIIGITLWKNRQKYNGDIPTIFTFERESINSIQEDELLHVIKLKNFRFNADINIVTFKNDTILIRDELSKSVSSNILIWIEIVKKMKEKTKSTVEL